MDTGFRRGSVMTIFLAVDDQRLVTIFLAVEDRFVISELVESVTITEKAEVTICCECRCSKRIDTEKAEVNNLLQV